MQKRGQVAVFVVIGIAVVILFVLLFYYKNTLIGAAKSKINTEQYLNDQLADIQKNVIEKCAISETNDAIKLFLDDGGEFSEPLNFLKYHEKKYRILCQNIPGKGICLSSPLTVSKVNEQFTKYLKEKINNCMDFTDFENNNYQVIYPDELGLSTTLNLDSFIVELNYPVELSKNEFKVKGQKVTKTFDVPLGEIIKEVNGVLDFRAKFNIFDPVTYALISHNKYDVTVNKPYPDEVYDAVLTDNPNYHFYFAITGEGRYDRLEGSR